MLQQLVSLLFEKKRSLGELARCLSIQQHSLNLLFSELDQKGIVIQIDKDGLVNLPSNIHPLSSEVIESLLNVDNKHQVNVDCQLVIDSTNQQLLNSIEDPNNDLGYLQWVKIYYFQWQGVGRKRSH